MPKIRIFNKFDSALMGGGKPFHLEREGKRWTVYQLSPQGRTRIGVIGAASVEDLRRRGLLVDNGDGTLKPIRQREQTAGGLSAERPQPPAEGATAPVLNAAESPLTWLRSRKDKTGRPLISEPQFLAGERLRTDFERAMLARRVTANWDVAAVSGRGGGNMQAELSDGAIAARQRFHAAMDAVGPELSSILYQVCCLAAGIEHAERLLDLPQRSGKAVLGLALTALSRHYGMGGGAGRRSSSGGHWAVPDYRPAIQELEDA